MRISGVLKISWIILALAVSACSNNLISSTKGSNVSGVTLNGVDQVFSISNVIQDQSNPSATLDLLGDGSGAMATYCYSSGGDTGAGEDGVGTTTSSTTNSGQTGTSDCGCTYSWTDPSTGAAGSVNVNTSYHESNMIECPYSMEFFPSDVTSISVSAYLIAEDIEPSTNSVTLNLGNGAGSGVSLTSASNYVQVSRYQCRDLQSIPYLSGIAGGTLGSGNTIYDPILSDDPELTYPLDFYTTNLGGTLASYIQNSTSIYDWNCPGNPNDPNYGNNYTLYSVGADSNGSDEIYPATGSAFDRSTFYVSKTQAGVFTVPVNAYIAPTMISASGNIGGPIGYAAAPVVISSDEESCPSVSIPSGYQWVKVWLFRANLQDRHYPTSPQVQAVNAIACNPSVDFPGSATDPVFADCGTTATCTGSSSGGCTQAGEITVTGDTTSGSNVITGVSPSTTGILPEMVISGSGIPVGAIVTGTTANTLTLSVNATSTQTNSTVYASGLLADRVLAGAGLPNSSPAVSMCVNLNDGHVVAGSPLDVSGAGGTFDPATGTPYAAYPAFGLGTDIWVPKANKVTGGNPLPSGETDPLDLFGDKYGTTTTEDVPKDEALSSVDIDSGQPRYDFVFVVTPTTVMAADMENSSNSTNYPYIPFRFPTAADCQSSNPNFPSFSGDCNSAKIINYGLKLHDVSSNGDPPASDPNEAGVFPMCALQPIK